MGKRSCLKTLKNILAINIGLIIISIVAAEVSSDASFVFLEGQASWYAEFSPGIKPTTANMEKFSHDDLTCAAWGLPFNTILEVTNLRNGRSIFVRVNDRGPAKRLFYKGRVIDLTKAAFSRLDDLDRGLINVKVRVVKYPG